MKSKISILLIVMLTLLFCFPTTTFGTDTVDDGKYTVYLHFKDIGSSSGFYDKDYTPQKLSYNTGWNFTKKKLDNFISPAITFEYDGDKYEFSGNWEYSDGTPVTFPISVKYNGEKEIHIAVKPVYKVHVVKLLEVVREDPIHGTQASASNKNEVGTYKHTFEMPEEAPGYEFCGWKNDDTIIQAGESYTWNFEDLPQKNNIITFIAQWQPSVVVQWYDGNTKVDEKISFESVNSNIEYDKENFDGWVDEEGNIPDETYYANGINEEIKIIKLYAQFTNPEPVVPSTTDKTTPEVDNSSKSTKTTASIKKITPREKVVHFPIEVTSNPIETVIYVAENKVVDEKEEVEIIEPISSPKSLNSPVNTWALLNLILMIATALCLLVVTKQKHKPIIFVLSAVVSIISILLFVFTEDTFSKMILVDNWTLLMVILFVIQVGIVWIFQKREQEE